MGDFEAARERTGRLVLRTPLIPLQVEGFSRIHLKLENLQPIGSFKIRCAANALLRRGEAVTAGVTTASAGNFAQGLAYAGRSLGIPVTAFVPETAARTKMDALVRLGAEVKPVPYDTWWAMLSEPNDDPRFVHPVTDPDVLAGNGTIALEIMEDLPEASTVFAPYGGGGLTVGIALALKAAGSNAKVVACETEAGAPLSAAFAAGAPVEIDFDSKTFITGMGGPRVLGSMWDLARANISATALVSLAQTADAIRLLVDHHHIVAEGAGAAPVAAAMTSDEPGEKVCIVSGGHLDTHHLITILQGGTP